MGFSLLAVSEGYSLVVVNVLLIPGASLFAEPELRGAWASAAVAPGLQSAGSAVELRGLSSRSTRGQ